MEASVKTRNRCRDHAYIRIFFVITGKREFHRQVFENEQTIVKRVFSGGGVELNAGGARHGKLGSSVRYSE
ncbi:protein of unknown function [Pararobbsia alpina]